MIRATEAVSGKIATHEKTASRCGLRHRQLDDTNIEVDQTECKKNLICIDDTELQGKSDEGDPLEKHAKLHPPFLGATARCITTRADAHIRDSSAEAREGFQGGPRAGRCRRKTTTDDDDDEFRVSR
eukprot:6626618-Pyramimonas_sp.AAC.1